jgi:hypothetical protein
MEPACDEYFQDSTTTARLLFQYANGSHSGLEANDDLNLIFFFAC